MNNVEYEILENNHFDIWFLNNYNQVVQLYCYGELIKMTNNERWIDENINFIKNLGLEILEKK